MTFDMFVFGFYDTYQVADAMLRRSRLYNRVIDIDDWGMIGKISSVYRSHLSDEIFHAEQKL